MRPSPRSTPCVAACGLLFATLSLGACGDGKPKPTSNSIAAAFENQVDPKANAREAGEAMKRLKEKAAADAEAAVLAEIESITQPAADAPTAIKPACEAMRAAHDGFVQKRLAGNKVELDRWNVMKSVDLDKLVETCVAGDQPRVAACMQNALSSATVQVGRDRVTTLESTCTRKYGQPLAAAPGKPAKSAG